MKQIQWAGLAKAVLPAVAAAAAFCVGAGCALGGVLDPLVRAAGGQPAAMSAAQSVQDEAPADTLPGGPDTARTNDVLVRISNGMVEWTTGSGWHSAGTLEALSAADPYTPAAVWEEYPSPQTARENAEAAVQPQLSFAAAAVPVITYRPTRAPAAAGGGDGGGGGGGGGGGAPAPAPTPTPEPPPSGGDGEDIGWSGDVLD